MKDALIDKQMTDKDTVLTPEVTNKDRLIPYPEGAGRWLLRLPIFGYRLGLGDLLNAGQLMILATRGRKSGLPRYTPIEYRQHGSKYYVVSAWGERPQWFQNLQDCPEVLVQAGRRTFAARAEVVTNSGEALQVNPETVNDFRRLLEQSMRQLPDFEKFKDNVKFSVTGEGLRIDLMENAQGTFFEVGKPSPTAEFTNPNSASTSNSWPLTASGPSGHATAALSNADRPAAESTEMLLKQRAMTVMAETDKVIPKARRSPMSVPSTDRPTINATPANAAALATSALAAGFSPRKSQARAAAMNGTVA